MGRWSGLHARRRGRVLRSGYGHHRQYLLLAWLGIGVSDEKSSLSSLSLFRFSIHKIEFEGKSRV